MKGFSKVKKKVISILSLLSSLIIMTSCSTSTNSSSTNATGKKIVLTFWKMPNADQTKETELYKNMIQKFEKLHPNIQVNYVQVPWTNAQQKLTAAFTSNNPPDITYQSDLWLDSFASQKALFQIDSLKTDSLNKSDYEFLKKGSSLEGHQYGVPYLSDFWPLVMNESIWEKAGKPALPQSYSELADFAKKLTLDVNGKHPDDPGFDKKHIKTYGFMNVGDESTSVNFMYNYLWSFGTDYLNKDNTDIGFNNNKGKAALQWLKKLKDDGIATPPNLFSGPTSFNDWTDALASGKIAIEWLQSVYPSMMKVNPQFKYKVLPVPSGPDGQQNLLGVGGYLTISAKSQHPKEALEFIKFLTNDDNETAWLKLSGFFPPHPMSSDIYNEEGANTQFMQEALPQEKYVRSLHPGLKFSPDQIVINEINSYLNGSASFEDMTKAASQQVKQMAANAGQ